MHIIGQMPCLDQVFYPIFLRGTLFCGVSVIVVISTLLRLVRFWWGVGPFRYYQNLRSECLLQYPSTTRVQRSMMVVFWVSVLSIEPLFLLVERFFMLSSFFA